MRAGRSLLPVVVASLVAACGDAASPVASADGGDVPAVDVPLPPGVTLRDHAVNIVDAEAAAEVRQYVLGREAHLRVSARRFYERFGDEYDFLYVFTDAPVEGAQAAARFTTVRRPLIPGTGIARAVNDTGYGSRARLRGVVGVNFSAAGNGPTLHETLHYWAVFLDRRFGFGRDRDQSFGAHWGLAGVLGQHGGFDPATLRCSNPVDAVPPCTPDSDGVTRVSMATFGPNANGGDGRPYAPIELYLMGLLPRAEVPSPITVLDDAHFVRQDAATRRMVFEITGAHTVTLDEIAMVHGERPPAPPDERAFRAAFVAFSDAPLSTARMAALERWAAIFGNDTPSSQLHSFERATGGRATMSTRLGPPRP